MQNQLPIIILLVLGFSLLFYLVNKKLSSLTTPKDDVALVEWLKNMQHSLEVTNKTLNDALRTSSTDMVKTLQENSRQLNERLDKAATVMQGVGHEVGQMNEIGRNMKELQEFLKSPKLRGNIGEQVLKDLIAQMFPKSSFFLQYQFKSGERVDAAIKTDAGILPIDSKFPMENFQKMMKHGTKDEGYIAFQKEFMRDVKKHIDAIAKKYIIPTEGTMDFALMYVPSESVYYELANTNDIIEYARKKRVYVVSPTTLYMHLQTILLSFEGRKIESKSREVLRLLQSLQIDYEKVNDNLDVLGKHLQNASSQFSQASNGFSQLGQKLSSAKYLEEDVVEK